MYSTSPRGDPDIYPRYWESVRRSAVCSNMNTRQRSRPHPANTIHRPTLDQDIDPTSSADQPDDPKVCDLKQTPDIPQPSSQPPYSDEFPPVIECFVPFMGRVQCPCCTSKPKSVSDLKTHLRRVHNIRFLLTPTTCFLCQRQFSYFQAASRHYTACSRKHGVSPTKSDLQGAASTQSAGSQEPTGV